MQLDGIRAIHSRSGTAHCGPRGQLVAVVDARPEAVDISETALAKQVVAAEQERLAMQVAARLAERSGHD